MYNSTVTVAATQAGTGTRQYRDHDLAVRTSANWGTIIADYFYLQRLYALSHDYTRLFTIIFLQKPKR